MAPINPSTLTQAAQTWDRADLLKAIDTLKAVAGIRSSDDLRDVDEHGQVLVPLPRDAPSAVIDFLEDNASLNPDEFVYSAKQTAIFAAAKNDLNMLRYVWNCVKQRKDIKADDANICAVAFRFFKDSSCLHVDVLRQIDSFGALRGLDFNDVHVVLCNAATRGAVDFVRYLCEHWEWKNISLMCLCKAAYHGHLEVLKLLVQWHPRVAQSTELPHDCSMLSDAAESGHFEVVQYLVQHFSLSKAYICANNLAIIKGAVRNGHVEVVRFLCQKHDHQLEELSDQEKQQLVKDMVPIVAANGHLDMLQFLHQHVWTITKAVAEQRRNSALRYACSEGHEAVVKFLVDTIKVTPAPCDAATALDRAVANNRLDVVCYLTQNNVSEYLGIMSHRYSLGLFNECIKLGHLGILHRLTDVNGAGNVKIILSRDPEGAYQRLVSAVHHDDSTQLNGLIHWLHHLEPIKAEHVRKGNYSVLTYAINKCKVKALSCLLQALGQGALGHKSMGDVSKISGFITKSDHYRANNVYNMLTSFVCPHE